MKFFNNKNHFFLSIGNALEFYDFALHGFYIKIFTDLFLPLNHSLITGFFIIYGMFTIGFLSRPIGGFFFGFLGDKYGRKNALSYSLTGIGLATFGIAILPTYKMIGLLSPILLMVLRILQGMCLGGEWTNSLIFVSEDLNKNKKESPAKTTGIIASMGIIGWFFASMLTHFFSHHETLFLSWRMPFFLGSIVAIIGIYLRNHMDDSYCEKRTRLSFGLRSIKEILKYSNNLFIVSAISGLNGALFFSKFIFNVSFLPLVTSFSSVEISKSVSFGLFCYMVFLPITGIIADRVGHKKTMLFSSIATFISTPFSAYFEITGSLTTLFVMQLWTAFLLASWFSPGTYYLSKQFPTHIRCTATAVGYNIGNILCGALAPSINLILYQVTKNPLAPAVFLICIALFSTLILYFIKPIEQKITFYATAEI